MQTSEKPHPLLGKTEKQPAIQDYIDYDHIVAPLASFDTIDLGDEDLTPTDENNQLDTATPTSTEPAAHQAVRPSELGGLNILPTNQKDCQRPLRETGKSEQKDSGVSDNEKQSSLSEFDQFDQEDLTPTSEKYASDEFIVGHNTSGELAGAPTSVVNNSGTVPLTQKSTAGFLGHEKQKVKLDLMSCANQPSARGKAKENKKPRKQRNRKNSSSSSEFSDDDAGKASGVSWSRRVHIYGKITSTSPTPPSPGLPQPQAKQSSPNDGTTDTVEILDLTTASASKKKAYLKKLQRLQVKTNAIDRPRSTTPINVFTLDEYVQYSSPENSPGGNKIKIKLPDEEYSPRNEDKEALQFNFNEEDLFSHTKSGILMCNESKTSPLQPLSPRRVLIPPSLTPTTSPNRSVANSPRSPRYIYCPSTNTHFHYPNESSDSKPAVSSLVTATWVQFDDSSNTTKTARNLSGTRQKSQSANSVQDKPTNLPQETEEVLQVHMVEVNNEKRDCSIAIITENKTDRCKDPVLESQVPDVVIASALHSVDSSPEGPVSAENSSVKEVENKSQVSFTYHYKNIV